MTQDRIERPVPPLEALTYTIAQTARVLGVSEPTVRFLADRGDLPTLRIGRRRLVAKVALEEWVSNNRDATFEGWPKRTS